MLLRSIKNSCERRNNDRLLFYFVRLKSIKISLFLMLNKRSGTCVCNGYKPKWRGWWCVGGRVNIILQGNLARLEENH